MWFPTNYITGKRGTLLLASTCPANLKFINTHVVPFFRPFRISLSRNAPVLFLAIGLMTSAAAISTFRRQPRPWRPNQVPVAFWAWRNQTPSQSDVNQAVETTKTQTLFLRA